MDVELWIAKYATKWNFEDFFLDILSISCDLAKQSLDCELFLVCVRKIIAGRDYWKYDMVADQVIAFYAQHPSVLKLTEYMNLVVHLTTMNLLAKIGSLPSEGILREVKNSLKCPDIPPGFEMAANDRRVIELCYSKYREYILSVIQKDNRVKRHQDLFPRSYQSFQDTIQTLIDKLLSRIQSALPETEIDELLKGADLAEVVERSGQGQCLPTLAQELLAQKVRTKRILGETHFTADELRCLLSTVSDSQTSFDVPELLLLPNSSQVGSSALMPNENNFDEPMPMNQPFITSASQDDQALSSSNGTTSTLKSKSGSDILFSSPEVVARIPNSSSSLEILSQRSTSSQLPSGQPEEHTSSEPREAGVSGLQAVATDIPSSAITATGESKKSESLLAGFVAHPSDRNRNAANFNSSLSPCFVAEPTSDHGITDSVSPICSNNVSLINEREQRDCGHLRQCETNHLETLDYLKGIRNGDALSQIINPCSVVIQKVSKEVLISMAQ